MKLRRTLNRLRVAGRDRGQRAFFSDALAAQRPTFLYQRHNVFTTAALREARRLDVPRVLEVNVPIFFEEDLHLSWLFRQHESRTFQLADAVIVVSQALRELLIELAIISSRFTSAFLLLGKRSLTSVFGSPSQASMLLTKLRRRSRYLRRDSGSSTSYSSGIRV